MLDNGMEVVNGRIWFVAAPVVSGHYIVPDFEDDDALFSFITDALGLGSVPAVIFDPRCDIEEIRFYPAGLSSVDNCDCMPLGDQDVRLEDVYSTIERVYENALVTPDAQLKGGKLWVDPDHYKPSQNAEAIVQIKLHAALAAVFFTCDVRFEQSMSQGRDDLEIERRDRIDPSHVTRLVLIELKVLRSFGEGGRTVSEPWTRAWIEDGVKQAASYAKSKSFRWSALCCFDMRCEDEGKAATFAHVRDMALEHNVDLQTWFIYSSSEKYREVLSEGRGGKP